MRIDVHAHYSPSAYFDRMGELGAFEEIPVFQMLKSLYRPAERTAGAQTGPDRDDIAGRIADMDAGQVDLQVVSLGAAQPYFSDPARSAEGSVLANDLAAELTAKHPDRFLALASLPLPFVRESLRELDRLDEPGFAGVCLGCSAAGIPLDDPHFEQIWAALDERSAIVFLHPGAAIHGIPGARDHHIAPDFVSPAEIAVAAVRLVVAGIVRRYPRLSIVLATTGGSLPFFAARFDRGFRQHDSQRYAELGGILPHLKEFYYDTSVLEEPLVLSTAAQRFGADRILLGSDYARPGVTSSGAVAHVEQNGTLGPEEKRLILNENAQRLFRRHLLQGDPR
ncbi:amidohydrolase family protein [Herbiconiux ginsengi]|uniref:Aminocarboxymuconate-semialdehyde decarboxylase n=1 Tax=Herbiconiux ginsengi TaxID=381665 RepID=A0A1H3T6J8_9MICO|nr:amidohydrolase family protein [Herbiconiux ginsengi]SDZ45680.1 aminocarboxymuconate-semialdehyde decarboxylase [Herbiconiux ginsengi]